MKRDFLKQTVPGITDEQLDAIMNEYGKSTNALRTTITGHETTIAALTTERDGLKGQVADRDKDIKDLQEQVKGNEGISQRLMDLQAKYDTDTKDLQKKLDDQADEHATEVGFAGVEFSSDLARRAAIAEFRAKGYKRGQDGKYAELPGYLEQLKKDQPGAFKAAEQPKPETPPAPTFTHQMTNNLQGNGPANPLPGLFFNKVRGFNTTPTKNE